MCSRILIMSMNFMPGFSETCDPISRVNKYTWFFVLLELQLVEQNDPLIKQKCGALYSIVLQMLQFSQCPASE